MNIFRKTSASVAICIFIIAAILPAQIVSAGSTVGYVNNGSAWNELMKNGILSKTDSIDQAEKIENGEISYKADIQAFDVSNHYIVIIFRDNTVGIFDIDMNILSEFKLPIPDKNYGITIHGENIVLIPCYAEFATEIDQKGEIISVYKIPKDKYKFVYECTRNNQRYAKGCLYYKSEDGNIASGLRKFDDGQYLIKNLDSGGRKILYDSHIYHQKRVIGIAVLVALAIMLVVAICLVYFFRYYRPEMIKKYGDTWVDPSNQKWADGNIPQNPIEKYRSKK